MNTKKYLKIILVIAFIVLIYPFFKYLNHQYSLKQQQKSPIQVLKSENKNNYINLILDFGDGNIKTINNLDIQQSIGLLSVLQELSKTDNATIKNLTVQNYKEMGTLLTSINNYKNGTDNKYWQYYVNGKQPMISIDKYIPSNNDFIELKFTKSQF